LPAGAVEELHGAAFFQGVADALAGIQNMNVAEMSAEERAVMVEEIARGRLIEAIDDANRESVEAGDYKGCNSVETVRVLWDRICLDF
jgi:hypothetical protein